MEFLLLNRRRSSLRKSSAATIEEKRLFSQAKTCNFKSMNELQQVIALIYCICYVLDKCQNELKIIKYQKKVLKEDG